MFAFITHMRAKPGRRDEVIALTEGMLRKTQDEDGVPIYVFHTAADAPDDFWFYDLYESQEASDAHSATDEFKATMGPLMGMVEVVGVTKLIPYGPIKSQSVRRGRKNAP